MEQEVQRQHSTGQGGEPAETPTTPAEETEQGQESAGEGQGDGEGGAAGDGAQEAGGED